jgi:hypothetical protein
MVLCLVGLIVFSVMSLGSAKYRPMAKELFKCVSKTLRLSPCDMAFEQRVKAKVTAKLLNVYPPLARAFYWNFRAFAWAFTGVFFASLIYTLYTFYNFAVYGSCEPGEPCYLTGVAHYVQLAEKPAAYIAIVIMIGVAVYLLFQRLTKKRMITDELR